MARRAQIALADGSTTNPTTITADGSTQQVDWPGGDGEVWVVGTFGGGTATLQKLAPDGATWASLGTSGAFTSSGVAGFSSAAGQLRVTMAGSTSPSVKAWVVGIPTNNGG